MLYIFAVSLASAFIMLLVFKKISDQDKISYHQRKIFGYLLEIAIYRDQFRRIISSQWAVLKHLFLYLRCTVLPIIILGIPVVFTVLQIDNLMGLRPLHANERFIIRVDLAENLRPHTEEMLSEIILKTTPGITVETPPAHRHPRIHVLACPSQIS